KRRVQTHTGFEIVSGKLDARHTPADLRVSLQQTRLDPACRQQCGDGQPADTSTDDDYVIRHTQKLIASTRRPRSSKPGVVGVTSGAFSINGVRMMKSDWMPLKIR